MFVNGPFATTENLGRMIKASPGKIANWIHAINSSEGMEILRGKEKSGRGASLSDEQMLELC